MDDKRKSAQFSGGKTAGATRGGRGGVGTGGGIKSRAQRSNLWEGILEIKSTQ